MVTPPLEVSLMAGVDGDMGWMGVGDGYATLGGDWGHDGGMRPGDGGSRRRLDDGRDGRSKRGDEGRNGGTQRRQMRQQRTVHQRRAMRG